MPEIKQAFIDLFLRKAKSEMEAAKTQGVPQPYAPSPELTLLYSKAVRRYDARRFTQVQDVERIFDFLEVEEGAEA